MNVAVGSWSRTAEPNAREAQGRLLVGLHLYVVARDMALLGHFVADDSFHRVQPQLDFHARTLGSIHPHIGAVNLPASKRRRLDDLSAHQKGWHETDVPRVCENR